MAGISDIKLDTGTADLAFVDYDLVIIDETERIRQQLQMTVKLFTDDWFVDRTQGIPYFTDVMVKNPDPVTLQSIFKARILAVTDVVKLLEFGMEQDKSTRELTLTFKVDTTYGEIEIDGVL